MQIPLVSSSLTGLQSDLQQWLSDLDGSIVVLNRIIIFLNNIEVNTREPGTSQALRSIRVGEAQHLLENLTKLKTGNVDKPIGG